MGRGARSTVRWKHDRIRRKKARDNRAKVAKGEARKSASAG
jgi:predicted metal-dependent HD superfamily phosphohydrolase